MLDSYLLFADAIDEAIKVVTALQGNITLPGAGDGALTMDPVVLSDKKRAINPYMIYISLLLLVVTIRLFRIIL